MKDVKSFVPLFYLSSFSNPFAKRRQPSQNWDGCCYAAPTTPRKYAQICKMGCRRGQPLHYHIEKIPKAFAFGIFTLDQIT